MNNLNKKYVMGGLLGLSLCVSSCNDVTHVCTTEAQCWMQIERDTLSPDAQPMNLSIHTDKSHQAQKIEGFGACFNELGWTSLNELSETDRADIMRELFHPEQGARFTVCRMPVAANDFSRDWYSYNEVPEDFEMKNFSIDNDKETLIPFIKEALNIQPHLRIWASPWCPPSWMKYNRHYASAYTGDGYDEKYRNGLPEDKAGKEGTDMFIQDPRYMEAYALYFKKFIQAYKQEGISIFGVMPQNEFNSAQIFPSCCWTAKGLATFVGEYLVPAMKEEDVDIMFGTMERPNSLLVDTILTDPKAGPEIKGVGFQWAGKGAIADIHKRYPDMRLLQTEQECGDGNNRWDTMNYMWGLLKHYMNNGVSIYDYWNISLLEGGVSRWGWAQNSLVVVDGKQKTYRYTYEYYLMKHISHFVGKNAVRLNLEGETDEALAFLNTDGSVVLLCMELEGKDRNLTVHIDGKAKNLFVKANSLNTWMFK